jgi:hypothetical protein
MRFSIRDRTFEIALHDTPTAKALSDALPIEAAANRWGDEIYCLTDVELPEEPDARTLMRVGEIAYWPPQGGIALFFGRTPASTDERPRAYSLCNVFGTFDADLGFLRSVADGEAVRFFT